MSIFEVAISVLAPPECINCSAEGLVLCDACAKLSIPAFGERCWRCNVLSPNSKTCVACRRIGSPSFVWVATDHDKLARDLLSFYKFGHNRAAAEPIARMMLKTLHDYRPVNFIDYLIIPVPTATGRMRQRGFGHSELLAKVIARRLGMCYSQALRRLDQTRQLGARREDRLIQLSQSFAVSRPSQIAGQKILLIDDVVTTGGTIISAAIELRAAGAKQVDALLFAKRL
jgi:ComF family protein